MTEDGIDDIDVDQMRVDHEHYHAIVNHPVRKAILESLRERSLTIEEIAAKTQLNQEELSWHITILESGMFAFVEKENRPDNVAYKLTKAGKVINYLE